MTSAALEQTQADVTRWADIADFPGYRVSDAGDVRCPKGRPACMYVRAGALYVNIGDTQRPVRLLVLEAFHEGPRVGSQSRNKDGNIRDCSFGNVEWVQRKHMRKPGSKSPARIGMSFSQTEVQWMAGLLEAMQRGADLRVLARSKSAATVAGKMRRARDKAVSK